MNETSVNLSNIIDITKQHHHISQLFNAHQKMLMHGDIKNAFDTLHELKIYISNHIKAENDYLLPLYEKHVSPIPLGGAVDFFIHEHHKIDRFMKEFSGNFSNLKANLNSPEMDIVKLFDQHYVFKHLLDHHHTREDTFLFRFLDRVLDESEKEEVLIHFSFK